MGGGLVLKDRWRRRGRARTPRRAGRAVAGALLSAVLGLVLVPPSAGAQQPSSFVPDTGAVVATAPHWVGEFAILSGNALLSGVTAGVTQKLRGGSFREGFLRGLLGGGVIYLGKRVAAEHFSGSGLVGREVASVGTSMVRNAGEGVGVLDNVVLPLGIVRLYRERAGSGPGDAAAQWPRHRVRVRLDAFATGWLLYAATQPQLHFDAGTSLSMGAPVFKTDNKVMASSELRSGGFAKDGVILLSDVPFWGPVFAQRSLHHEMEHVIQDDQLFGTWIRPAQATLFRRLPGGRVFDGWVDLDFSNELLDLLSNAVPQHDVRPWELEAVYLSVRR